MLMSYSYFLPVVLLPWTGSAALNSSLPYAAPAASRASATPLDFSSSAIAITSTLPVPPSAEPARAIASCSRRSWSIDSAGSLATGFASFTSDAAAFAQSFALTASA